MTLLKELIEIPERIQKGDFVLRLTEGVQRPEETLRDYVVTPELARCFEDALSFIQSAQQTNTSKAAYLHGSFGSGKSHFMAVLHLILQGNTAARGIPELASSVTKHNAWIAGKKFLLVPYHMIGARSMEEGILGGYVDFVRRAHPEAPVPGVYLAEAMFQDAQRLRETMGEAAFFGKLNQAGAGSGGGWGELDSTWDARRFEDACDAEPGSELRSQLIGALVSQFFGSYDQVTGHAEAFVSLDKGLSVLSKHAAALGYQGLILFLDELVLWLASHAADLKFVHQEGQKLAKLVEAQMAERPIPIVSFVARQRDLSELIGTAVPGAERLNFSDALRHWEGRFHRITLEDRNLPAIAERRVLKVKNAAARQELEAAFQQTAKIRDAVMNTLLTSDGDRAMFRKVYPFSPALVQTLIAVSSVLQRERTALKVMMQLLVDQRESLVVGDIVPVGDLFDVVAHGDEAFSPEMALHFDNAKRLYHQKLLPLLEKQHGRREDLDAKPFDDPQRVAFRNDDRLIKTLLLAAIVPEVESLRALNSERLAALNHGTIRSPIQGREGAEVLRRCRNWAASVGELRVGEEATPTLAIKLMGVDTEGIIEQARKIDNKGNRIRRVRELVFEALGIEARSELFTTIDFTWRNTHRSCGILFQNIRELPDSSFENDGEDWKLIIDWPFDEDGHGPRDDISRIQTFKARKQANVKTLCWVPAFLSHDALKELGMLVILEHVLLGENFSQYSNYLSPQDRQSAKATLENQRSVLRSRVKAHLEAAYGLSDVTHGSLDTAHDVDISERFVALQQGLTLQPPAAGNLRGAMEGLLDQAYSYEYPAAPRFEAEVKPLHLKRVFEVVGEAASAPDGRVPVDRTIRGLVRQIANPLLLGEMAHDATHFVLGNHWRAHFTKKHAETGDAMTVAKLCQWMDLPRPMGLPEEAARLVILVFARQTNRSFFLHNAPYDQCSLTHMPSPCELREQKLPDEALWRRASSRAGAIFGLAPSPLLNASNVGKLTSDLAQKAAEHPKCQAYYLALRRRMAEYSLDPDSTDRARTARLTVELLASLRQSADLVKVLAEAPVGTSEAAMGTCFSQAVRLEACLADSGWNLVGSLRDLRDSRATEVAPLLADLVQALRSDEHVCSLGDAVKLASAGAVRILTKAQQPAPPPPPSGSQPAAPPLPSSTGRADPPRPVPGSTSTGVRRGRREGLDAVGAKELLSMLEKENVGRPPLRITVEWDGTEGSGA